MRVSQICPSWLSPSPTTQYTRPALSDSLSPSAMPAATERPWPREPVAASAPRSRARGARGPGAGGAGGGLDAGQHDPIRVALERAAQLAQRDQPVHRKIAGLRHAVVLRGHAVALGEHEPVAILPARARGIVAHAIEVERGEDVDHRQRAARMPGSRVGEHPDDLHAPLAGDGLELRHVRVRHQSTPSARPAIASACTPATASDRADTTCAVPRRPRPRPPAPAPPPPPGLPPAPWVVRTVAPRRRVTLSLIRIAFASSGSAIRPS